MEIADSSTQKTEELSKGMQQEDSVHCLRCFTPGLIVME